MHKLLDVISRNVISVAQRRIWWLDQVFRNAASEFASVWVRAPWWHHPCKKKECFPLIQISKYIAPMFAKTDYIDPKLGMSCDHRRQQNQTSQHIFVIIIRHSLLASPLLPPSGHIHRTTPESILFLFPASMWTLTDPQTQIHRLKPLTMMRCYGTISLSRNTASKGLWVSQYIFVHQSWNLQEVRLLQDKDTSYWDRQKGQE